ncbi:hypothetical protein, unlikely [Trypanosoma brucei gambiense DAL972]|uniref:Uncharacterized protein n=1 Tax=Trypanosoma brucei gambiense (strain MHOM/CI/86/DAL972) TaxID=679716 RepID=D0A1F5_TRYB9|nr:hypothetical protein, unlikely [Trypanosoma brucei gambiense DAL972]CBH15097.1 hypothetical protein, unlikely [Trypanosoma brucei gambiense DAL972]|eukprot:XP_011777363.1 hypothetical protein, unlikely [Trypanosoma brucei gambiense DAL972]
MGGGACDHRCVTVRCVTRGRQGKKSYYYYYYYLLLLKFQYQCTCFGLRGGRVDCTVFCHVGLHPRHFFLRKSFVLFCSGYNLLLSLLIAFLHIASFVSTSRLVSFLFFFPFFLLHKLFFFFLYTLCKP